MKNNSMITMIFIVIASLNLLYNLAMTFIKEDTDAKLNHFNAFCGWLCSILYAIQVIQLT